MRLSEQNGFLKIQMSFLQKSLAPSFRRKPESRIVRKYWIPGRASLARNDDFLLFSRVLQEAQINTDKHRYHS